MNKLLSVELSYIYRLKYISDLLLEFSRRGMVCDNILLNFSGSLTFKQIQNHRKIDIFKVYIEYYICVIFTLCNILKSVLKMFSKCLKATFFFNILIIKLSITTRKLKIAVFNYLTALLKTILKKNKSFFTLVINKSKCKAMESNFG